MSKTLPFRVLSVFVVLLASTPAHAALVAEMTFRSVNTVPNPDQTPITNNKPGSSNLADLSDGGSNNVNVNTGATGLGFGFSPDIRFGFLDVPDSGSGGTVSINTAGSNGDLNNYLTPGANMGSGTLLAVMKPDFSGAVTGRYSWFAHNVQLSDQIWLFNSDDTDGPRLIVGSQDVALPLAFDWNPAKWYFIGGSWQDTPLGGSQVNRTLNVYIRELNGAMPAALSNTKTVLNFATGGLSTGPFYIGRRSVPSVEAADGDIALFQMYDNYFSIADFGVAYNSMFAVPEPSSLGLLSLSVVGYACRRRRRTR